jgi:HrpA-like RNA helicase
MGITDITSFEFVEMPSPESIVAAIRELKLLGAIDVDEHDDDHHRRVERYALTDIGRQLVSFPLAPNHAKSVMNRWIKCSRLF